MNIFEAIVLGLVQGLTEFLPVSSSGHLELGKYLFGIDHESNFFFSIAVHGATLLSTLLVFWNDIVGLLKGLAEPGMNDEKKYGLKILVSMIPVGIAGFFMYQISSVFFAGNMLILGIEFMITSLFLILTTVIKPRERNMTYLDAFIIGLAQVLAVTPGISRSGATIATGMMLGNRKTELARFSFLMVLIPIAGANLLEVLSGRVSTEETCISCIIAGFITAFITGFLACKLMVNLVKKGKLAWFAVYCIILGIFSILLGTNVI
ncbi:MAG: undecaprenyl-diphosphate phosphatase [Bacteroidales bacterium]|jgi:undecaprenyl-diphosphatase|nr:undecaprenyl-diphosphate phosphatase [Bacteroidales bacterium]